VSLQCGYILWRYSFRNRFLLLERTRESPTGPPEVKSGRRGDAAVDACGAATARVAAPAGASGEEAATTTRDAAGSTAMATRFLGTRVIREMDTRAGGRTAAEAAGTAGDRTAAATTAGATPTKSCIAAHGSDNTIFFQTASSFFCNFLRKFFL
jgi:hypothetical protein